MKRSGENPPRLAVRFLEWFCPAALHEGIEGDLAEQFDIDVDEVGYRRARFRFMLNVIRFFRPAILLRNKFSSPFKTSMMISNYITVAIRNIQKRKLYAFINAFGLSLSIAFCTLIYLFIQDEKSFDQFHANKDNLYRMYGNIYDKRQADDPRASSPYHKIAFVQLALAPSMKAELPEVKYATHFSQNNVIMRKDEKVFREPVAYVDSDFFDMFSFPIIHGSTEKIFATNNEIVLTPGLSQKYFGREDATGEVLHIGDKSFTVAAIIAAPPANSSLQFQALLPVMGWGPYNQHNLDMWFNLGFPTFVQLHENTNLATFQEKLDKLTSDHMKADLPAWRERESVPAEFPVFTLGFTPVTAIHMEKEIGWDKVSDPVYTWILSGIALLILIIACINYIGLALTSSTGRNREVGIRKVVGAIRKQLVVQFGTESLVLAFLSMIVAMALVVLFLPSFNLFTGKAITLSTGQLLPFLGALVSVTIIIGLAAGGYPALYLSRFLPALALKGGSNNRKATGFTKPLVVLQFAMSAFLMISSVIMYRQMQFVTTKNLGYNHSEVVVIPTQAGWGEDANSIVERFRQRTAGNPDVVSVSATDYPFAGGDFMIFGFNVNGENKTAFGYTVDAEYVKTLDMQIIAGRDFDAGIPSDTTRTIIVNEALVKDMKWNDPLQEYLNVHDRDSTSRGARVIGVVKDFHFLSLAESIKPMFLTMDKNDGRVSSLLVKISGENIPATLARLQKDFTAVAPDKPFEYSFMDENVARQYASFDRGMSIMTLSTVFAILVSCLGLFGLAGINALNRTKEVGIRKVMGAQVTSIFLLLNRQFIWLSLVAFTIAAPLSWFAMRTWLGAFEYRIVMGWELFAISLFSGMAISFLAVSYHGLRAALINPSETLKHE